MTLGQKLKELRKEKGLTTREISKLFNLGKSTISNYENDSRKPDYEMIKRLAEFYSVSTDYLLGNEKATARVAKSESDNKQIVNMIEELKKQIEELEKQVKNTSE